MKNKLELLNVLLLLIIVIFFISIFRRDNYYLNIATIIAGCFVFFILNVVEPIKSFFFDKSFNVIVLLSIIINLGLIVIALLYLFAFKSYILVLISIFLCIFNILLVFFVKKEKIFANYIFLSVMLLYLFINLSRF